MKALVQEFWYEEDGLQTVELVLILIVMVGLVISLQNYAKGWMDYMNKRISDLMTSLG